MLASAARRHPRRRTLVLAALAATAAPIALAPGSAAAGSIPGDHHSSTVAALAAAALADVPTAAESSDPVADEEFRLAIVDVAVATSAELQLSARELQLAWLATDREHQVAMLSALSQLGAQYQSVSSDPEVGFDCSGLTSYAWRSAGVEIPRPSGGQIDAAEPLTQETAMAGDLVEYPGHVMMYLGVGDAVVHASNPEDDVELWMIPEDRVDNVRWGDPTAVADAATDA